jgi:hypothetical protein
VHESTWFCSTRSYYGTLECYGRLCARLHILPAARQHVCLGLGVAVKLPGLPTDLHVVLGGLTACAMSKLKVCLLAACCTWPVLKVMFAVSSNTCSKWHQQKTPPGSSSSRHQDDSCEYWSQQGWVRVRVVNRQPHAALDDASLP